MLSILRPTSERTKKRLVKAMAKAYFPYPAAPRYLARKTTSRIPSSEEVTSPKKRNPVFLAILFIVLKIR